MGEVLARDDVNWQAVQEVHNRWKEENGGVGGPGMQLVSLAMAVALALTPGGQGFATGVLGMAEGSSMTAAVAAGFNSLVLQAGMQIVANGGDIGAALQAMASIETVRSLATAMLTAGLMNEALSRFAKSDLANNIDGLAEELTKGAIKAGINTGVGTAINGGNLGENLLVNMRGAAVSVLGAEVAHEIGKAYDNGNGDLNYVTHKISHAILGGAIAAANGEDFASGAIGGAVGEIVGEQFQPTAEDYEKLNSDLKELWLAGEISYDEAENLAKAKAREWMAVGLDISKLAAGVAAAAAGGDVDTAANTADNAVENNAIVTAMIVAGALWAAYATYEGNGDIVEGVKAIGAGDDTFSKLVEAGVTTAVEKAYEVAPGKTKWVFGQLESLGDKIDVVITFTDKATGEVVSRTWSSLDQETRDLIKGSADGIITVATAGLGGFAASSGAKTVETTVIVTAKKSGKLFDLIDDACEATRFAKVAEKAAVEIADAGKVAAKVGDDIARVVEKVVIDNMPTQLERITTSGVELVAKPGKTTTILGRYGDDMKDVIGELGYPKTLDFEAKPGRFNVLNIPSELSNKTGDFWNDFNKPFLDAAIERGDDIVLATKPDFKHIYQDGNLTTFGKEYEQLRQSGYIYDATTSRMVKP